MPTETTPAVARALDLARAFAATAGAAAVEPRHLFAALTDDPDGRPAAWVVEHGLELGRWRQDQPRLTRFDHRPPDLPLAPAGERSLESAAAAARASSADRIVTSDHVLLGVLSADPALRQELAEFGLRADDLEAEHHGRNSAPLAMDSPLDFGGPVEQSDAARIVDACANRAREAIRVLEDYVRFALDDAFLSRQLKELRHDLAEALASAPSAGLLAARETQADVGAEISTPREQSRFSVKEVVQANLKRLQEALRSLEEYGKLYGPDVGRRLEELRYRAYTLERAILLRSEPAGLSRRLADAKLYVLLGGTACRAALDWTIAEAAAGGADVIQLREKNLSDGELLRRARDARRWTRDAGALFVVNDRPDIARLAEADGVHLGQDDLPVREARRILGPDSLIGVSTHTIDQVRQAVKDGASYIGVGPTFTSSTKDFEELAGLMFVRAATAETSLPAFVLGGVTAANVQEVVHAGGRRVAVSAAVAHAENPRAAAKELRRALP
jgi:thiamine-phosphate pyrophosphorylase